MTDQERAEYLVKKWSDTGLLDGKTADSSSCILLESQQKQTIFDPISEDVTKKTLSGIEGVTYTTTPNALINWDTMEVFYGNSNERPDTVPFATKSHKERSLDDIAEFVKNNKHQIVVYSVFLHTQGSLCNFNWSAAHLIRFARKPGCTLL